MKVDRIIWGLLFLFVGGVILLDNFNIIEFYWRNVWRFWPVLLIVAGVNLLVNRKNSPIGGYVTIAVTVISLAFLFWKGQQPAQSWWFGDRIYSKIENDDWEVDHKAKMVYSEAMPSVTPRAANLNFNGGGYKFSLEGETDSLLFAESRIKKNALSYTSIITDSVVTLEFSTNNRKNNSWNVDGSNQLKLYLNKNPEWNFDINFGAGELDMDLRDYRVKNFEFNGGATDVDIVFGNLVPLLNVVVKAGVSDIKIKVPFDSGCQIVTSTGMSMRNFRNFKKVEDGLYETEGYAAAKNKINIKIEGGLGNFEVQRN